MKNEYLPHVGGGAINTDPNGTSSIAFNWGVTIPVASDPRTIISVWGDEDPEAYGALSSTELFAGLQIYCLSDKKLRVCRWIPSYTYFNIGDCVWDVLHNDGAVEWQSVEDFEHEDNIDERIAKIMKKSWKFNLVPTNTYWGFTNKTDIDDVLNELVNNTSNNDYMVGYLAPAATRKGKSAILKVSSFTDAAHETAANGSLMIVIPSTKIVATVTINGEEKTFTKVTESLVNFNTDTNLYDDCSFDVYTVNGEFSKTDLESLTDTSVVISFTA